MRTMKDDCTKRRLTERREITVAVDYLRRRGIADDQMAVVLSRSFYVDIDELNAVLAHAVSSEKVPESAAGKEALRAVA